MLTESQLAELVRNNDPKAVRYFGARLEKTSYLPLRRSDAENVVDYHIRKSWPKFGIIGKSNDDTDKACLWDVVVRQNGKHWAPMFQETGSCVQQGGWAATAYTMAVECWVKNEPEEWRFPWCYLAYGRSRHYIGDRGPGEGSLGSAMARAVKDDGILPADTEGLPKYYEASGGLTIGRANELAWSYIPDARDKFDPFQDVAKLHPVRDVAQARRADDVSAALRNGYACSTASMWGGRMKCGVTDGVLLNERVDQWSHQMAIVGWMVHPRLGELFYILNSWGNPHGEDPAGGPPGGFWVRKADVEFMCKDEVFIYSNVQGFPARAINWNALYSW